MTLRTQLDAIAADFARQVLSVVQGASLHELAGHGGAPHRRTEGGGGPPDPLSLPTTTGKGGRLRRRSAVDIAKTLDKIVLLVKTHNEGMRAEEIRSKLGMQPKEMPRILKEGIAKKKLMTKGQKRATTYFAR
jgi:hypothetical protein